MDPIETAVFWASEELWKAGPINCVNLVNYIPTGAELSYCDDHLVDDGCDYTVLYFTERTLEFAKIEHQYPSQSIVVFTSRPLIFVTNQSSWQNILIFNPDNHPVIHLYQTVTTIDVTLEYKSLTKMIKNDLNGTLFQSIKGPAPPLQNVPLPLFQPSSGPLIQSGPPMLWHYYVPPPMPPLAPPMFMPPSMFMPPPMFVPPSMFVPPPPPLPVTNTSSSTPPPNNTTKDVTHYGNVAGDVVICDSCIDPERLTYLNGQMIYYPLKIEFTREELRKKSSLNTAVYIIPYPSHDGKKQHAKQLAGYPQDIPPTLLL